MQTSSDPTLEEDFRTLKAEIWSDLLKARAGQIIDISKLPDRLQALHMRIAKTEEIDRAPLITAFEEVLGILDELSKEIQHRYNEISGQLKILDADPAAEKE